MLDFNEVIRIVVEILGLFMPQISLMFMMGIVIVVFHTIINGWGEGSATSSTYHTEAPRAPVPPPPPLPAPKIPPHTRVVVSPWEMIVLFAMDNFFSNCKHCGARFPLGSTSCQQCGAPRK